MKSVLDLIREFGTLSDAKVSAGGRLPPPEEKRWEELKAFYDLLMSQNSLPLGREVARFSASDIRQRVTSRERLRVPAERYAVLQHEGECHTVLLVNVSRGGVFVASDLLFEIGSRVTLYFTNIGNEKLVELQGEIVWRTEQGIAAAHLPRGMGVRFVNFSPDDQKELDALVIETIQKRLSGLW